ncbi:hypothetical protein SK128_010976, partial [Halocaridina rubra]
MNIIRRSRERNTSLSSSASSSSSTFYVHLVEEVPRDVFPVRVEFLDQFVLEEEEEEEDDEGDDEEDEEDLDLLLEDDTLSELSSTYSHRLDGYGS